jgi:tetratricopeptide (TPR) repeat protein
MLFSRLFAGLRSARAEFERGTAAARAGRMSDAIIGLRRAIELKPDYAEAHYNLGAACREIGDPDAALAAYRRTAELAPNFADVHQAMGSLLRERRDFRGGRALPAPRAGAEARQSGNAARARQRGEEPRRLAWRARAFPARARGRSGVWARALGGGDDADPGGRGVRNLARGAPRGLRARAGRARDVGRERAAGFSGRGEHQPFFLAYQELSNRELLAVTAGCRLR